jgi:hypothetical protein
MNEQEKTITLKIEELIDIILEKQDSYSISRDILNKLEDYFNNNSKYFGEKFIRDYIDFLDIFNQFFTYLLENVEKYEQNLIDEKEVVDKVYFAFDFKDFNKNKKLKKYSMMIDYLESMFPNNSLLQGVILYIHLNKLLNRHMFINNKIKVSSNIPLIEIDYGSRLSYYKEEYVTIFRHELEEGIRSSVFLDNDEVFKYILDEIRNLKNEIRI